MDESTYIYDFGEAGRRSALSTANTQSGSQIENEASTGRPRDIDNSYDTVHRKEVYTNESHAVVSNENVPLENGSVADSNNELKDLIRGLTSTVQVQNSAFSSEMNLLRNEIAIVQSQYSSLANPDPEIHFNYETSHVQANRAAPRDSSYNRENRPLRSHSADERNIDNRETNRNFNQHHSQQENCQEDMFSRSRGGNSKMKIKPQIYSENDDFDDFLTQFEITAEINSWSYNDTSLYLASSLSGSARSLLNELNPRERRDFNSLVEKLQTRYGSENKSEVFRTQLKTRTRSKTESISELAHAVKKMTRQAYPTGSPDVIESLAIDNFIDALNDSEIRLRLSEVSPKNLSEAQKIAIRMEAHRLADRQRSKLIGSVGESFKEHGKEQNSPNSQDSSNPQNKYYKGPSQYNR